MRARPVAALLASLFFAGVCARADAPSAASAGLLQAAADEFDEGRRAFKAKDFAAAAVHFENADRDVPNRDALKSAIRAHREAGHMARAGTLAAAAIDRYGDDAAVAPFANEVIAQASKAAHRVVVSCKPACTLVVDGKLATSREAVAATLFVERGRHVVGAGWSGERARSADVEATAGGSSELAFEAPAAVAAAPVPAAASGAQGAASRRPAAEPEPSPVAAGHHGLPKVVFGFAAATTGVLGAITIWSGLDTKNNPGADKVRETCAGQGDGCPLYQDGLSRQTRTNVLIGVTSVAALATAALGVFFTDWSSDEAPAKVGQTVRVVPTASIDHGTTLGLVGRF